MMFVYSNLQITFANILLNNCRLCLYPVALASPPVKTDHTYIDAQALFVLSSVLLQM